MEVVVGAIQVGRHHGQVIGTVLQVEALAHLQADDFRQGIRFIGIFERPRQQIFFLDGLRTIAGIDACRAQDQHFLHPVAESLADDILLYLQIFVYKIGAIGVVGHNPAHMSGGQDDIIGAFFVEKAFHGDPVEQVELGMRAPHQRGVAFDPQVVPNGRAYQPPMAGDIDFRILFHTHCPICERR